MKQAILDTNFILSCIRNKIDFFEEIPMMGLTIIIPEQVIDELNKIAESKQEAKLAIKLLEKNKFKKVNLENNYVDKGLEKFAKDNKTAVIATLDRELKKKLKNQKLIIRGKKKLELI